uniref:Uncharacterized protein n=1 Tax=Klebsiella pneumoniae TaxID=573 RepID=A0A8B0SSG5_KLEPN|nr:hypothetical protein [Klebsiella pneumoniae]
MKNFYGKTLTLPPLSDGSYVITSDILNTQKHCYRQHVSQFYY